MNTIRAHAQGSNAPVVRTIPRIRTLPVGAAAAGSAGARQIVVASGVAQRSTEGAHSDTPSTTGGSSGGGVHSNSIRARECTTCHMAGEK